ncbi:ricin-type beta-trefoil lectin domain protein [Actinoplanes sp. NPDC023714]|uniref:ricin-type beta-trefoil lectin domain protein n=1 Tax=Actinoplanes sp. NPDC023714 TaxID=3154322 RepID=UPI0033C07E49
MRRTRVLRGLLTATAAAALVTMVTGPALAAPSPVPVAPSATPAPVAGAKAKSAATTATVTSGAAAAVAEDDGLPTDEAQKVRAAREIGIEPGEDWLSQSDRNFVFKIWQNSATYPLIRTAAELALSASGDTIDAVCKEFILKGIFDAKVADDTKKIADETAARQARDLKREAYAAARITVDANGEMLILPERDVVYEIWKRAEGARVKAAALAAFDGDGAAHHEFLANGVKTAAEQDVQDAIEEARKKSEEEAAKVARAGRMTAAAAVLGILADAGKLAMSDDNFVRWIWEQVDTDPRRIEIRAAAEKALRSSDPAVWWNFIDSEIHAANGRDRDRLLAERAAADRQAVQSLRTKATADGNDNLVTAATHALLRNADGVSDFLLLGQYQVAPDAANRPAGGKPWQWTNVSSGKCLAAQGDAFANGTALVQTTCASTSKQRWVAMRVYNTGGSYRILSAYDRTKCVGVSEVSAGGSNKFTLRTCDSSTEQRFYYTKQGDNFVWVSELNNRALTIANTVGATATAEAVTNGTTQQFYPTNTELLAGQELSEAKVLQSYFGHNLRLQGDGNVVVSKGPKAVWATDKFGARLANQRDGNLVLYKADGTPIWSSNTYGQGPSTLRMQTDGNVVLYRNDNNKPIWSSGLWDVAIVASLHNKCVTVPGGNFTSGTQLTMQTCDKSPSQQWMAKGNTFISMNNLCIDLKGTGKTDGTAVQAYTCNGTAAQNFVAYTDDSLRVPAVGKCLDIPQSNKADGVKLQIWTCNNTVAQKWTTQQTYN